MMSIPKLFQRGFCYFAISCCTWFTGLLTASGQSPGGFSQVHFDGTFLILGQHILDTSDIGVLLQETNANFQILPKSNGKDVSWDSDGVRYTTDSQNLKITWVVEPAFLHSMGGHPLQVFQGKLSIFDIEIALNKSVSKNLLSKDGFAAVGDHLPRYYRLEKNGWKINIITDRNRNPEAVTLEHSLNPD
jgi:hypothetical protein